MLSKKKKRNIIIAFASLLACMALYAISNAGYEETDDAAIESHVVSIIPKIPGYITKLYIQDNQAVKAGDVLLQIDTTDYQIALDKAKAELEAAQARLDSSTQARDVTRVSAPSALDSARSQVTEAEANWERALANLRRYQDMGASARSRKQLDDAASDEKAMRSALDDAKARLRTAEMAPQTVAAAESNVHELQASVKSAQANVEQAIENLKSTTIIAPIDGNVTKSNINVGTYVQSGQELLALVSSNYWVVANFKETQLTKMHPGQAVDIKIDAYPSITYHGKIDSIQAGTGARFSVFPPENATGNFVKVVQRVPVKILFDTYPDASLPIAPGMSVIPKVHLQ